MIGRFFKCRCAVMFNHRCAGSYHMKGTWKYYKSLIHLIYPYGLHREHYQLKDNNPDNMCKTDGWIKVVTRNSARLLR